MRRIRLGIGLAAAIVLSLSATAFAGEPNPDASCAGIGSSAVGPLGTRDNVAHATQNFAASTGVTPGYLVTTAALNHAGSFGACFGQ